MNDWQSRGACNGAPPGIFYPDRGDTSRVEEAKAICAGCPVRDECFDYALHHEKYGVWAGTSPRQRASIRARRGILLRTPGTFVLNPIDDIDDGYRTAREVAEITGMSVGAVEQRRHRRRCA